MSSKIRKCVRELERGEEIDVLLPEYAKQYMIAQDSLSRIRMMMEYYMFYEMISEGLNPYVESAKETADALHGIVEQYFEKEPAMSEVEKMAQDLLDLRREVIDRMDVLTAYVDRFVVYEYVLNRIQYRFDDMETMPSDGVFAQDLLQFIFGSRDNAVISDNIRFAVGQLPMRMTRSRYFDLIKESLSLYKDADKSSLDGFLYMFRTNAMLYRNEHMKEYFTEFVPVLEEFEQLDYDNMDEATYRQAAIDVIQKLADDVGIPKSLSEAGVKREDIPFLAESAFNDACTPGNPRDVSLEEIIGIYESIF